MSDKQNDTKKEVFFPERPKDNMPSEEFMEAWVADAEEDDELDWWFDAETLVNDDCPDLDEHVKRAESASLPRRLHINCAMVLLIARNPKYRALSGHFKDGNPENLIDRLAKKIITQRGEREALDGLYVSPAEFRNALESMRMTKFLKGSLLQGWCAFESNPYTPAEQGWEKPFVEHARSCPKFKDPRFKKKYEHYVQFLSPLGKAISDNGLDPLRLANGDIAKLRTTCCDQKPQRMKTSQFDRTRTLARAVGMIALDREEPKSRAWLPKDD